MPQAKSEQYIHIATLRSDADGRLTLMREEKLNVRCKKNSGPAIAYGNNQLFLAWVGRGEQKLNLRRYGVGADSVLTFQSEHRFDYKVKGNAGPALGYGMNTLAIAWLRKNR